MSRVVSLIHGDGEGRVRRTRRKEISRNEAEKPECTPKLAGSSDETERLVQELGHPRTFLGSLSWVS